MFLSSMWIRDEILVGFAVNGLKDTESLIYMTAEQQQGPWVFKYNQELQEERFHMAVF